MATRTSSDMPRPGRPPKMPKSPLGKFLWKHLKAHHLTQKEVSRRLGTSEATVSRLVHGRMARFERLSGDDVCDAFELDAVTRRQFFQLAASAGVAFAGAVHIKASAGPELPALVRYHRLDLDLPRNALLGWEVALSHDHDPREVLVQAQQLDDRLREVLPAHRDPNFAELRMRSATLLAAAQEAVEPWRATRPERAVATYDSALPFVYDLPREKQHEQHMRLALRHAVLRREQGLAAVCAAELDALRESDLLDIRDPILEIAYRCQRMHTISYDGPARERAWREEGDRIRRRIEALSVTPELRAELHAILTYTYGVGNKAFMWRLVQSHHGSPLIRGYAARAYEQLDGLRASALGSVAVRHINLYHPSISPTLVEPEFESSLVDALVWHDPHEAARRMEALRIQAERLYPTVLRKLDDDRRLLKHRTHV